MTETNKSQLQPIRRALISVSNKEGIVDLAQTLKSFNVEIISTGGTATALREAGIEVKDVSDITGFPEMMDGRVKTLHPKIHGGLLALRENPTHVSAMHEHGITPIDMVVVNLYPFEETVQKPNVSREEAIEQIDIGGPSMIRSAAKNFRSVTVVVNPDSYRSVADEMAANNGATTLELRERLAAQAFAKTATYDLAIAAYFKRADEFSETKSLVLYKSNDLRYGENPHQQAALYSLNRQQTEGLAGATVISGKEMSFNNYVDAEAAWQLVNDFGTTAVAIIKHTNPAGVGLGSTPTEAYQKALATDPVSAFGGIVAFNCLVDADAADEVSKIFTEVVIAPDYDPTALEKLKTRKNLRVLRIGPTHDTTLEYRQISGGVLVQTRDTHVLTRDQVKVVTNRAPSDEEIDVLLFAWTICKHTKSNAIVYARNGQTVGVGAGQMSRVDSVRIGAMRAQLPVTGSVLASDAFFPFRDGIDEAAKHGITAIIQPGGSVRDDEVIAAANEHGLAMVFTQIRHFKH